MSKLFKVKNESGEVNPVWRAMVRIGPGRGDRRKVKLFTDKRASQEELKRLQSEADSSWQDPSAARRREHSAKALSYHVADYLVFLKRTTKSAKHLYNADFMLKRLLQVTGWRRLSDLSQDSAEWAIGSMMLKATRNTDPRPATVAYRNCFVKRLKAFTAWLVPDRLAVNPLLKLKRCSTVRAEVRRGRRDGTTAEIAGLFRECDSHRRLALGLTVLAGLRRSEAKSLKWGDVHLDGVIPFLELRKEWTKNGRDAVIPVHPVLRQLLVNESAGMPGVSVVKSVPEVETIEKYLTRAGFEFVRDGLRLDHHALRHTFVSNLGRLGVSRATRKALARHSSGDVTDGYEHCSLQEMYEAVKRLASPLESSPPVEWAPVKAVASGTDLRVLAGAPVEHTSLISGQFGAFACTVASNSDVGVVGRQNRQISVETEGSLTFTEGRDTFRKSRPSTQVD